MTHFPIKVKMILTKLALIKPKYKEKKDLQQAVCKKSFASSTKEKTQKNGGGNALNAKCALDNPIPCKALGGNSSKKECKLCQNCMTHSHKIKYTYSTSEYHKWNPDGSLWNGEKQACAQTLVSKQSIACFAQM